MKTKMKPIISWSIWAGGLSLIMGVITRNHILNGFRSDTTGMSFVIATLFCAGLIISFRAALVLHTEWEALNQIIKTKKLPLNQGKSELTDLFNQLAEYKQKGETIDAHSVINTYHTGHNSRVRTISIMSGLLISMGLLGTIIGLIMSISGLSGMVENIGLSRTTMMEALKATVAGMGTAFYTTFFGALGGLILRAVAVSQLNSLSELCAAATEYADINLTVKLENKEEELNQQLSKVVASFKNMQDEIDSITTRISESFESTLTRFGEALGAAGQYALETTQECISGMTEQMDVFGSEIGSSFGLFNESIEKAGEEVHTAISSINISIEKSGEELTTAFTHLSEDIGKSSDGVTESFNGLNESVKQAGDTVGGSLADFKLTVDDTSIELKGAVDELHTAIRQATGEMVTMASAKLDTEASEIAGQLSLAASSIQKFMTQKGGKKIGKKVA